MKACTSNFCEAHDDFYCLLCLLVLKKKDQNKKISIFFLTENFPRVINPNY